MPKRKSGFDAWVGTRSKASSTFREEVEASRAHIENVDDVVRVLDAARIESGMTKADLARAVGLLPDSVRRLFTAKGANPTLDTTVKLAEALGLRLSLAPKATPTGPRRKNAPRRST